MSASGGPLESLSVQALANPAAGADWTYTLTAAGQLAAIISTFVTSAAVANRFPAVQIQDGSGHVLWQVQTPSAQIASLTHLYGLGPQVGMNAAGNTVMLPIPPGLVLPAGAIVKSVTTAIDVADQWSNVVLSFDNR